MNVGEWTKEGEQEEREMTYIKPLHAAMGPKVRSDSLAFLCELG